MVTVLVGGQRDGRAGWGESGGVSDRPYDRSTLNAHSASATVVAVSAWRVEFLAKAAVLGPTAADAE